MDIVTLGAALNGSAEYVNSHFKGGSNIQIVDNPDGTQTINASGEVSSEDTVARAEIAEMKDGTNIDSFGDVETALAGKVDKVTGKGLSTNDYTVAEKTKLAGIEEQANKTTVDDALSGSSTNPVQNKVIKSALDSKADTSDIPTVPITAIQKNGTGITPVSGTVNITVPTQASDINAATATQGGKADTAIQGIKVNSSTVNPDSNKVVSITVPTSAADVSALPDTTKYAVALSLTINSSTYVMTGQLKDQNGDNLGTAQTIDLPLESVVVGGSYNSQTKKVVLTLQNGNTIEFSVADLVSGLQTELSTSNKLNPAFIEYDSTHRAVSDTEKSTWNSKQNALSSTQLAAVNSGIDSTKVAQIETNKSNISSVQSQADWNTDNGVKNRFNFDAWKKVKAARGTLSFTANSVTLTATGNDAYTNFSPSEYPVDACVPVTEGETVILIWDVNTTTVGKGQVYLFCNGTTDYFRNKDATVGEISYTIPSGVAFITFRLGVATSGDSLTYSNIMVRSSKVIDATYQPYAKSNAELTAANAENETNISNVIKDIYLNDVYDSTALVSGKIIDYRDGRETSSQYTTDYACTNYIPLSQGDFVKLAYVQGADLCGGAVYDADKNFIKTIWGTDDWQRPSINLKAPFNFVANDNIAYLRYNVQQNSVYPRNKQYIKIIKAPILSGLTKELNVITVGTNGIFTTLKSCCDYIKDNNIIGAKVYVQAGTYDLVTEFGTDYLDNITSDANIGYGLYIGNNTHFVFAENAKVKFIYDGANSKAAEHFAPFNVYGSCILENANVEVTNARYCVHEDVPTTSIYPDEYTVKYINCVMRHNGATVSTGSHTGYVCIGAGVNKNSLSIIDGGIYSGSWTADISYHNYNSSASSRLIVRNVYMTTGLRLQDFGSNTVDTEITGCYMPTLTGTYTKFNVKSWNNVNS